MTISEKLSLLREKMQEAKVDAYVVFSADPHMSEYLPQEWQERKWITGFTGSAGFAVFTKDKAGLWTDGRYFVQATAQLQNSGIELMKDGVEGTPNYIDWIIGLIPQGGTVAVNAVATSHIQWAELKNKLEQRGIQLIDQPLLKEVWTDRPSPSKNKIFIHPLERAGKSVQVKLTDIRQKMVELGTDTHVIAALDDVAWTLNLRGSDVESNPVFIGYLLLTLDKAYVFVDFDKVDDKVKENLKESNVELNAYENFYTFLKTLENKNVLLSPTTNQAIYETLQEQNKIVVAPAPGNLMKAKKNKAELEGFRTVMVRDGVALAHFFYWLTHQVGKELMDEYSIGEKLHNFRAAQKNFVCDSFSSIVGYQSNGAIIHYSAPESGSKKVTNEGAILVDSGGQYLEGTTDITRTLPLSQTISDDFKRDYTLVLKGMIRLSRAKFPKGTMGVHLDVLARQPLWNEGKDYRHGTGHGVGSFMNVHEGPQNIRKDLNPIVLDEGMVISNEPGYYWEDHYGIRLENLITVRKNEVTDYGQFYDFETLTLFPFFKEPIDKSLLSEEEIQWLNDYHQICKEKLSPHLDGDVKSWFEELVRPL